METKLKILLIVVITGIVLSSNIVFSAEKPDEDYQIICNVTVYDSSDDFLVSVIDESSVVFHGYKYYLETIRCAGCYSMGRVCRESNRDLDYFIPEKTRFAGECEDELKVNQTYKISAILSFDYIRQLDYIRGTPQEDEPITLSKDIVYSISFLKVLNDTRDLLTIADEYPVDKRYELHIIRSESEELQEDIISKEDMISKIYYLLAILLIILAYFAYTNEKIRKFLKPSKFKILAFVILLIINYTAFSITGFITFIPVISLPSYCEIAYEYEPSTTEFTYGCCTNCTGATGNILEISWIYNIIYWYLLSCLIAFTYNKFKTKLRLKYSLISP